MNAPTQGENLGEPQERDGARVAEPAISTVYACTDEAFGTAEDWWQLPNNVHSGLDRSVPLRHVCDEANCVRLEHLLAGTHQLNMADMGRRGRADGSRAEARTDIRGPAGRARAIRAALSDGWHPQRLDAAREPWRQQLALFA